MYAEIVAAVQSTKTLAELLKSVNGLSNHVELMTAVNTVQEKLSQALITNIESTEKQQALRDRVRELENQIAEIENWGRQIQSYALFKFPTGSLAYAVQQGMDGGEPPHYLCATCVGKRQKSILQPNPDRSRLLYCRICKTDIPIQDAPPSVVQLQR